MPTSLRVTHALAVLLFVLAPLLVHAAPPARGQQVTKPSIILVHGAWADGSSWDRVVPILQQAGYTVVAVHLPMSSTADNVAAVTRAIEREPGDVILVGHSYGGTVISEAGNHDKVKGLVYVAAFALDDGESINKLLQGKTPPDWVKGVEVDGGGYAWLTPETVAKYFVQDLPATEQKVIAAKQGPLPVKSLDEEMKQPAWKTKPSWYVRATADKIIDPAAQDMMAKRMKAKLTSISAGHVAMLSKPRDVSKVILQAANQPAATASK